MENTNPEKQFICETCRKIDFSYLLKYPLNSVRDEPHRPGFLLTYTLNCVLCNLLLSPTFPPRMQNRQFGLKSFSFLRNCDWAAADVVPELQDSVQLLAVKHGRPFLRRPEHKYVFCCSADEGAEGPAGGLFVPRMRIRNRWDCELAASWLSNCKERHGSLCNEVPAFIEGLHLIDCEQSCVVKAERESSRWIALSYVWGSRTQPPTDWESNNPHPTTTCGQLPADLPRTIQDAISVTKGLGYRFLWVDEYCVDQTYAAHRDDQISRMDQIYRGADLVIVAAAGQDKTYGLPGVSSTPSSRNKVEIVRLNGITIFSIGQDPKLHIETSKWFTRGWIFQEGWLSKRLLVFTDEQMSYYCQQASWMERLGGPEYITDQAAVNWKRWPVRGSSFQLPLKLYTIRTEGFKQLTFFLSIVQKYSVRELSFESDALRAFSGVMQFLRRSSCSLYNISGLPYLLPEGYNSDEELDLCLEHQLFFSLSWLHTSPPSQRRAMFPSWTWAGWSDGVYWLRFSFRGRPNQRPSLRNVRLESARGIVALPTTLGDPHASDALQALLDSVTAIRFDALVVPAEEIAYGEHTTTDSHDNDKRTILHLEVRGVFSHGWLATSSDFYSCFLPNLVSGTWSCLLLGTMIGSGNHQRFLLVVEWLDGETARRIGGFQTHSNDPEEESRTPFEEGLQWRGVRLI
ncbi:HET-domain-containing protein [Cucurbitaria berberidis CBS 394.84]|uniref:HET-domain-containing protein n=1 Tax=Cucurbitaria berberidis CBS 394.84 TaxID=1168544 RepID=A0A9P4GC88_9PLEO|nr:HET-domain-containing protein [Cucurbitaria berberidis CBS 394.84]KAF1842574.1 HET-domain-containing protein [Cucurbitaria berberidis CBS 394.84]